jgi:hypothetical protein
MACSRALTVEYGYTGFLEIAYIPGHNSYAVNERPLLR